MNWKDMIDKASGLVTQAETLLGEGETLPEEKAAEFDRLMKEAEAMQERAAKLRQVEERAAELKAAQPAKPTVEFTKPDEFKSFGEFLFAVKDAATPGRSVDNRLQIKVAGMSSGVASDGGFLVRQDWAAELLKRTYETGQVASRCRRMPIGANSDGLTVNAIDESTRATSRWGGIVGYWQGEGGTKTHAAPKLRSMSLKLKKLTGLCYATDELLADAAALQGLITEGFAEEFAFQLDDAIVNGTGVGQPLGVMASGALVTVSKETGQAADTLVWENIKKMWARMWAPSRRNAVWFINQDVEPQLYSMSQTVGTGGVPVYLPAGGASAAPYASLFGRPVVPIEQCDTIGDLGDILLADMQQYLLIDKGGMTSESSIHVRFIYDETTFRFVYRADGQPAWDKPLTPYKTTNTLSPFVTLEAR